MLRKLSNLKKLIILLLAAETAAVLFFSLFLNAQVILPSIFLVIEAFVFYFLFDRFDVLTQAQSAGVKNILGTAAREAYLFGGTGMVIYDDNYVITWMSELFTERGISRLGTKLLEWLPEADDLIAGSSDLAKVQLDQNIYEISRKEDAPILFFRDVTQLEKYRLKAAEEQIVIGQTNFDNYDESTLYEDENNKALISATVRTPLTEYCKDHGILLKRMDNSRYLMVLNEKIFSDLVADHFSVLAKVRKASQKQEVSITLSMAFARGAENYEELDDMVANLMDLAQTRGGDQVAVQKKGEDVKYFGGSTEATEKRSRVRVRVIAHSLSEVINRSSNVIICCHKEADFDCMGAAIAMSRTVQAMNKTAFIIARTGGIEEKLKQTMDRYADRLEKEVSFVTESEALNQLKDDSLVIMVDHHSVKQSNGPQVLEKAKRVAVIDHHRRIANMGVVPMLVYIEAGASSSCELIAELIPYICSSAELSDLDATIMLAGMTIDTGRFKTRTGSRTYDAASYLRQYGADPMLADEFLKDTYDEFALKASIMAQGHQYKNGIMIAPVKSAIVTRSLMSQTADSMLEIQDVNAAFVIANDSDDETAISARSNGRINVQLIMEHMKGGGHMTAAAMQRPKCSIDDLQKELLEAIDTYFKEEQDESNTEK